jgi:hypothetical protein
MNMGFRTICSKALLGLLTAFFLAGATAAAAYPDKPVTIVVPYPAGGATDVIARMLAEKLTAAWKQQVVVTNKTFSRPCHNAASIRCCNPTTLRQFRALPQTTLQVIEVLALACQSRFSPNPARVGGARLLIDLSRQRLAYPRQP